MSPDKLVHTANQIAAFFNTLPHEDAAARVAEHINKFWEPRMRRQLFEHMDKGGQGLDSSVMKARPLIHKAAYSLDA
jgi:formate dehydrogenase subunit delta